MVPVLVILTGIDIAATPLGGIIVLLTMVFPFTFAITVAFTHPVELFVSKTMTLTVLDTP